LEKKDKSSLPQGSEAFGERGPSSTRFRLSTRVKVNLAVLILWHILLILKIYPVRKAFFPLAWLTFIGLVDSIVYELSGSSLYRTQRRKLLLLMPCSLYFWLIFELYNMVIKNWKYADIPAFLSVRWIGYAVCFSTVLLALFETTRFLDLLGLFRNSRVHSLPKSRDWYAPFALAGVFFLVSPLVWPKIFFPCIWIGFFFLLEPLNHALGGFSLMRQWEQGSLRTLYLLLVSGAICGFLWEVWNYWAITKWVYVYPSANWLKIFEMPVQGYAGFPLFGVESYVMMNTVYILFPGFHWMSPESKTAFRRPVLVALAGFILLFYCLLAFHLIDLHSIASYRPFEFRFKGS
jgi:hypothetical protein